LGIVVGIIVSTFLTVLTKSTKVKIVEAVENNGEYALRIMERTIRNAGEIIENSASPPQVCEENMERIKIRNPDGSETEFFCFLTEGYIAFSSASGDQRLTSPRVNLDSCQFNCFPGGVDQPDWVEITFTLSQSELSLRVEEQALIDFRTMVSLRNY